jgi:hypothetical protein
MYVNKFNTSKYLKWWIMMINIKCGMPNLVGILTNQWQLAHSHQDLHAD